MVQSPPPSPLLHYCTTDHWPVAVTRGGEWRKGERDNFLLHSLFQQIQTFDAGWFPQQKKCSMKVRVSVCLVVKVGCWHFGDVCVCVVQCSPCPAVSFYSNLHTLYRRRRRCYYLMSRVFSPQILPLLYTFALHTHTHISLPSLTLLCPFYWSFPSTLACMCVCV